ncbi:hypothetical protein MACJ_002001 [Theileria orientalis]|uniref:Uncharacterized protein n=1 Tax=Theileria orientalis TaxID=68886 RepID=A0A976QR15_THEOR|nr:hypothetical protein MACJ_002001 [Theileria orientalis]
MSAVKFIILISLIRNSLCIELTMPISCCNSSQFAVSNTLIKIYNQEGDHTFCRLYKYESVSGLITKVKYKQLTLYTTLIPPESHSSRVVYEIIGDDFGIVVITLGAGVGVIEGGYYIKDNKVYDIWSLDAVINEELMYVQKPLKQLVEEVIYSKLPDMRHMHSFCIDSVHSGDIIIAQKPPLNLLPNITIDTMVCIIMNRVLVGHLTEPESEEIDVVGDNQPRPLDYSLRKRN